MSTPAAGVLLKGFSALIHVNGTEQESKTKKLFL